MLKTPNVVIFCAGTRATGAGLALLPNLNACVDPSANLRIHGLASGHHPEYPRNRRAVQAPAQLKTEHWLGTAPQETVRRRQEVGIRSAEGELIRQSTLLGGSGRPSPMPRP